MITLQNNMYQESPNILSADQNKNILVTGAAGLVGCELVKQLLDAGEKVTAIYNSTPLTKFADHPLLTPVKCDILDIVSLEGIMLNVSEVYHCAAVVSFDPAEQKKLFDINVTGTANVVNAALEAGIRKLVHVSSVAALGRIRPGETITEKMSWSKETSNSFYGKTKFLGEMEVWRGIGEGLDAVIVNPTIILGGDNWDSGSSAIFKSVFNEFPWYTEGVSGFVGVADVARAMRLVMKNDIINENFILNAENLSYKYVFEQIASCFHKKLPSKKVTPFIASVVWRAETLKSFFTGKKPLLTRETAKTAQATVYYSNDKIKRFLPDFEFIPIKEIIKDTCATLQAKFHL